MFQVNGKPFIMLAGEAHNSNSSTLTAMKPVWKKARELAMNSVLLPVSWELVEPAEGNYDFTIVDGLIREARENSLKLGFLWFGTWKNAGCSYAPAWVKKNTNRFPRANGSFQGFSYSPLSVHGEETKKADARAFGELCRHIRTIDAQEQTVVYIQVENEAGLMGAAREHSDLADKLFSGQVPEDFSAYLHTQTTLQGDVREAVTKGKASGTWEEVFGSAAAELFHTYHLAKYVDFVAAAGKAEYDIPMAVNAWLDQGGGPGTYPTGGPINKMLEVWKFCAPHIDILCPDVYVRNFVEICDQYTRLGGPLVIPETATHSHAGPRLVYTIGHHHAWCFSPFGFEEMGEVIDSAAGMLFGMDISDPLLNQSQNVDEYRWYNQTLISMMQMLAEAYGTERLQAVISERPEENTLCFGAYRIQARFDHPFISRKDGVCLGVQAAEDVFYVIANGCSLSFASGDETQPQVDYLDLEEGCFQHENWVCTRRINGDEALLAINKPTLLRIRLYSF